MQSLNIDVGIKEFDINGRAVLRFNPSDPNVYSRFVSAANDLTALEDEYVSRSEKLKAFSESGNSDAPGEAIKLLADLDLKVKDLLTNVFGTDNDFNRIFDGVNVMAMSGGERVITNFFNAIRPIIEAGANEHLTASTAQAAEQARLNREQRRAAIKS